MRKHLLRSAAAVMMAMTVQAAAHPGHAAADASAARATAMSAAASAFVATLSAEQRARIERPFADDAARTNWSNLPTPLYPRDGLPLTEMTAAQRVALHDLLAAATSSQGYAKATTIMWIEEILREQETARMAAGEFPADRIDRMKTIIASRQAGNYWVTISGTPGGTRWGWMLSGHHLAVNFTVVDGKVAFTPLFVGAEPQVVKDGQFAGWRVLDHEIVRAFALVRSLDAGQRRSAILADAVAPDQFTGKGRKDGLAVMAGVPASRLDADQQRMLWGLVREFVGSAADEAADAQMRKIERDGMAKLHFAWWGPTDDPSRRFMYRIHGPSILIEYVREERGGAPTNHVHAIVRDPSNDYGEDWLAKHYREQPHP